jgi:hypothetical protein
MFKSWTSRTFNLVVLLATGLVFTGSHPAFCQKEYQIKKMIREYGTLYQGVEQGVEEGQHFLIKRPDGDGYKDIGTAETVKVIEDRAAIRLVDSGINENLKVGDLAFDSEEEFLLYTESFRNLIWGMETKDLSDLEYDTTYTDFGGIHAYHKAQDNLMLGDVLLDHIEYQFWQYKLSCIRIEVSGYKRFLRFREVCNEIFGIGHQQSPNIEEYTWTGNVTFRQLKYYKSLDQGILWISSRESIRLQQEQAAHEEFIKNQ